jgi:hypothetical protein
MNHASSTLRLPPSTRASRQGRQNRICVILLLAFAAGCAGASGEVLDETVANDALGTDAGVDAGRRPPQRSDAGPVARDAGSALPITQLPPTGAVALQAWLAKGYYKSWKCEAAARDSRPPSGHSPNRVCSNALASAHGTGEYPVGAASVKELFDDSKSRIIGYAVEVKVARGAGESFYWFEVVEGSGVVADGPGSAPGPKGICVGCHSRAGTGTFGHDLVYTQIR